MKQNGIIGMVLLLSVSLVTQGHGSGTTGAEFLLEEVGAAASALAAGQADSRGLSGLQKNPASLLGQSKPSFSFTHFTTFGDTTYEQVEGLLPIPLGGNLAARFFYASTYDFPDVDEFGQEMGTVDNHDMLIQVAYAQTVVPTLETGTAIKYFESTLAEFSRTGVALDFGVRWQTPVLPLSVGLSLQNVGTMSAFAETVEEMPTVFNSGIALNVSMGQQHQIKVLADISTPMTGDENNRLQAGLEYAWNKIVFLRGGYRFEDELGAISLGGGISYAGFGLDYGYQPLEALGENHRFTLSYIFGMGQ
jgi:hypothetical protein